MKVAKHKPENTSTTMRVELPTVERRPGSLCLRIDEGTPQTVNLDQPVIKVGRSRTADLTIRHGSISKLHFALRSCEEGVEVEDLNSKNGLWFADRRIQRVVLKPGDVFHAGRCRVELLEVADIDVQVTSSEVCGGLFGQSVVMRELFAYVQRVARSPLDVLIFGETGTGKEVTARTLHELSPRRDAPFVVLDCSSLPSTLADAALFGFRRGAFTGADRDQPGLFEQADKGTLFIDEFGELPPDLQAKFLRALDRREVSRIGDSGAVRSIDVRVLTATNRDLQQEVANGRFREDLYHRVRQAVVWLPALRTRGLDVIRLAEHFLDCIAEEHGVRATLGEDAKAAMLVYAWPGNVRELKNVIKQSVFTAPGAVLRAEDLRLGEDVGWTRRIATLLAEGDRKYEEMHMLVDQNYLPRILEEAGSLSKAAKTLGITRDRLRARLRALGLYEVES